MGKDEEEEKEKNIIGVTYKLYVGNSVDKQWKSALTGKQIIENCKSDLLYYSNV